MTVFTNLFQVGTRVRCTLPYAGHGIVFAVHGVQVPETVRTIGGGVGVSGGNARLDVVFSNGSISRQLSEALVRGSVQWRVLDEVATPEEVQAAIEHANKVQAEREAIKREEAAQFAAEVERLKSAPEYSRLVQGEDTYSGVLAAKNIRAMLKLAFPAVKFSVRKKSFGSLVIEWLDGPTEKDVQAVAGQFRAGHYCAQEEAYQHEKTPWCAVFGAAEYISVCRRHSGELIERAIGNLFNDLPGNFDGIERPSVEQYERGSLDIIRVPGLAYSLQQLIRQALNGTRG